MKKHLLRVTVLAAVCALALSGQALAGNGPGGNGKGLQTNTATQTQSQDQLRIRDRIHQPGTGLVNGGSGVAAPQGAGQASGRQLGLRDGSELAPRPQDGTGFGSQNK
jgi:hypothetical protein